MRSSFTITFILLLFCSGCNRSTGVVEVEVEVVEVDQLGSNITLACILWWRQTRLGKFQKNDDRLILCIYCW